MNATADSASERLGRFVAETKWKDLPAAPRREAKRSLLNFLGCALGVARGAPVEMAVRVLEQFTGSAKVTLIGRTERLDCASAAFVNAVGGNLLDYDDTHLRTVIHPTAPVAPVALALAEQRGLSGIEVLRAFILGAEVECRIGNAVSPAHYARGWHITSTCGVFGAAAAAAALLRLTPVQTAHALGLASSQSAGHVENLPSAGKNVSVGNAARNGLFAALLAKAGYTAAPRAIEGPLGWARAMGDVPSLPDIVEGLGDRWEFAANTYKPWPCGIVMHAVIDACRELRNAHGLTAGDIATIEISGEQLLLDRGDRFVANNRDARVSIHHCAAVAFLFGAAGLKEFEDSTVHDPTVAALRGQVSARLDPASPRGTARATVVTRDGRILTATVAHPKGSAEKPLTDRELEDKARDSAAHGGFGGDMDAIFAALWRIETSDSIRPLMRLLAG